MDAPSFSDNIHWLGQRLDPQKFMAACDLTTLTSAQGEGFPNVIAESLACGTPVITTRGVDIWDELENGGAVIVEQVFALPGIGQLTVSATSSGDIPVVMGVVVATAVIVVVVNLLIDLAQAALNPKVRLS